MMEYRRLMAESSSPEIDDELEFEDIFRLMEDAVDLLFKEHPPMRRKWRKVLVDIRNDDVDQIEEKFATEFERRIAVVRSQMAEIAADQEEESFNEGNVNNINVTQYNIHIHVGNEDPQFVGEIWRTPSEKRSVFSRVLRDSMTCYVGWSVGLSVGLLVCQSVGRSVGPR